MSRRLWLAGTATVLLGLAVVAGCKVTDFSLAALFQPALGPEEQLLAGSVDVVASSIDAKLTRLGMVTNKTRDGDAIRVTATTRTGQTFDVVLNRHKSDKGEVTHAHFEWKDDLDGSFKGQVKAQVNSETSVKP